MRELNRMPESRAFSPGTDRPFAPLVRLRVLDLSRSVAGGICAQWLAALGADVTRCSPMKHEIPGEVRALPAAARAALEAWLHRDKHPGPPWRGVLYDLTTAAQTAEWIVEDWLPHERAELGWEQWLNGLTSRPIDVSVTDWGLDPAEQGPLPDEARRFAESGHGWYGATGHAAAPPGWIASVFGGLYGAMGALLAWHARRRGARVRLVEHAVLEGLAGLRQQAIERWHVQGTAKDADFQRPLFACRDGIVAAPVSAVTPPELLAALTCDPIISAAGLASASDAEAAGAFRERLAVWFAGQPRESAVARAQSLQLPFGRVRTLSDVLAEPHFAERGFWRHEDVAGLGRTTLPGLPFRFQAARATPASSAPWAARSHGQPASEAGVLPLAGLRVLELGAAWAGPMVGRLLAEYGAEVVRIEPPVSSHSDVEDAWISRAAQHRGKLSLTLDFAGEPARETLRRLAALADVVLENFRPGVMDAWGCGVDVLSARNPALVGLSLSGFGRGGPLSQWRAFGATVEAEAGWAALAPSAPGGAALCAEPLSDPLSALCGYVALLAALVDRQRTGLGGQIDLSQAECALHAVGDRVALASVGCSPERLRGADVRLAPYPTRTIGEVCEWAYLRARDAFVYVPAPTGATVTHLRTPLRIEGVQSRHGPAAAPSADSERVLRAWMRDQGGAIMPAAESDGARSRAGTPLTR